MSISTEFMTWNQIKTKLFSMNCHLLAGNTVAGWYSTVQYSTFVEVGHFVSFIYSLINWSKNSKRGSFSLGG